MRDKNRRWLAAWLVCAALLMGCETATSGGEGTGSAGPGLVVVHSDYLSSSVSLLAPEPPAWQWDNVLHSGSRAPVLTMALSGDVVLASAPHPAGWVTLVDRFPNAVVTFLDPATGEVFRQISVATSFPANPQDVVFLDDERAYVPRNETNPSPTTEPGDFDEGDDLLVLDLAAGAPVGRVPLTPYVSAPPDGVDAGALQARPSRALLAKGLVWVGLTCLTLGFDRGGAGVVVAVDPATDAVVHRLEVPDGANCGTLSLSPDGETLWLACSGVFQEGAAAQLARSGVARIVPDPDTPSLAQWLPASAFGDRPLGLDLATDAHGRAYVIALGDPNTDRTSRLLAVDSATGTATTVLEAAGPFALTGLFVDGERDRLWVGRADPTNPTLRWYDLSAGAPVLGGELDANPSVGLPPRAIGSYAGPTGSPAAPR